MSECEEISNEEIQKHIKIGEIIGRTIFSPEDVLECLKNGKKNCSKQK